MLPQILSKAHLFKGGEQKLQEIKTLIQKLNPSARVLVPREDKYGDLDVGKELMLTGLFDMEEACTSAGWLRELALPEHTPETEEYGISSTIFRAKDMPFHPMRLNSILNGFGDYSSAVDAGSSRSSDGKHAAFSGVVRAKGKLWLANAHAFPIEFHVAGKHVQTTAAEAPYLAALERHSMGGSPGAEEYWGEDEQEYKDEMVKNGWWQPEFGDRASEVVFIGVNLNKELIAETLTAALLTEEESKTLGGVEGWRGLEDPFFDGECASQYFDIPEEEEEDDDDA